MSFHGFIIQSKCNRADPIATLYVHGYVFIPAIGTRKRNSELSISVVVDGATLATLT